MMLETMTTDPLEDDFCDILGKAMHGCGLDPAALATATGGDPTEVAGWLRGTSRPTAPRVHALAELLGLGTAQLQASAEQGWHPQTALPQNVIRYGQHPQVSNGYVFVTPEGSCAVIDPAGSACAKLQAAGIRGEQIAYILITHRHADHCDAVASLQAYAPQATTYMHPLEAAAAGLSEVVTPTANAAEYAFGTSVIRAFVVPGHTDGLTLFAYDGALCVGDLFFAGSVGRTFGPRTTYALHLQNIRAHVLTMNPDTVVLPGHGPPTTIALEKNHNPFLSA